MNKLEENTFNKQAWHLQTGDVVFREGEVGREMYIILSGEVEIRKKTAKNAYKVLVVLKKGDFFGEMAIIEDKPRTATAVALTTSRLMKLDSSSFYGMVEQSSDFAVKMIKTLSFRLRKADLLIEHLLGSNDERQTILGLASYVKSHSGLEAGHGEYKVVLRNFFLWSSNHLGYSDKMIQAALLRLIKRRILRVANPKEKISEIFISRNLLNRL